MGMYVRYRQKWDAELHGKEFAKKLGRLVQHSLKHLYFGHLVLVPCNIWQTGHIHIKQTQPRALNMYPRSRT